MAMNFSWVRIGFIQETDCNKPNPTKISSNALLIVAFEGNHYTGAIGRRVRGMLLCSSAALNGLIEASRPKGPGTPLA